MFNRKELKERAKLVLLRSYSKVFLACLIVNIISSGGFGISTRKLKAAEISALPPQKLFAVTVIAIAILIIGILLSVFVLSPLRVGLKKFMIENAEGDAQLDLMIKPFNEEYKNIVIVQFIKNLFITLWSIPAILPTIVLALFADRVAPMIEGIYEGSAIAAAGFLGVASLWVIFTLILAVPSIIKGLQYTMVAYILADTPDVEWRGALSKSKEMMVGNKWEYVKLILSFALWYLAANLLCCVGGFLIMPYIEATVCELYLELSGQKQVNIKFE